MKSIILAGGSGSRLWPLSRDLYPKQLLAFDEKESLLQKTFHRLCQFSKPPEIVTVTNIKHSSDIKLQLNSIDKSNVVISEPLGKNTAPAIACTLEYFKQTADSDDVVIIVPSDHLVKRVQDFTATVEEGYKLAQEGYIVTFGIKPTYPETGYGYIKTLKPLNVGHKVEKFVENLIWKLLKNTWRLVIITGMVVFLWARFLLCWKSLLNILLIFTKIWLS